MAMGQTAYVTVKTGPSSYEWKRISLTGGGASASDELPKVNGDASAGTSDEFSRGDHVHPHDPAKQDLLQSGVNIKTVGGMSLLGEGDIPYPTGTSGGEPNIINGIKITDTEEHIVPVDSNKNATIPMKTLNGQTLYGTGDVPIQFEHEKLIIGDKEYDGSVEVNIPITDAIKRSDVLEQKTQEWEFTTKGTYCTGDIDFKVTAKDAVYSLNLGDTQCSATGGAVLGSNRGTYISEIDSLDREMPWCDVVTDCDVQVNTQGWLSNGDSKSIEGKYHIERVILTPGTGIKIDIPEADGTITTWTIERNASGDAYTY